MALTEAQRNDIRLYCGYGTRFRQFDSILEQAMNALDTNSDPSSLALIQNALTGDPPGILACLRSVDAQRLAATKRFKAIKVGSIELNTQEMDKLCDLGRVYVTRLCAMLGVPRRADVFSSSGDGGSCDNYIGK